MEILKEILEIRTARQFVKESMEKDVCDRILEAGRLAPSAKNRQPWRFISLRDSNLINRIQEHCYNDERVGNSAVVILLCTTNIDYRMPNGQLSYPMDLSFAASYMTLQAQHEGWNSAILSTYNEDGIKEVVSIPYSMRVPLILLIGNDNAEEEMIKKRMEGNRIFSYDHW